MRIKTTLALLILLASISMGVASKRASKGIEFEKLSVAEAVSKAKSVNKPIFVYVYASWCGQCKQLKRTAFKDEAAGIYFNKNFINIALDGESPEGQKLAATYNVDSYPTMLILDKSGALKTRTKGVMKPYILINFGRRIVP